MKKIFIIIIFCILFIALFFSLYKRQPIAVEEKIEVFLEGRKPYFSGENITVRVYSSCGEFELFFDSKKIFEGVRAVIQISLEAGNHTILAKNEYCLQKSEFEAIEKECEENEVRQCLIGNCSGTQICSNGLFGKCVLEKKECTPGTKVGCSVDACRFGYKTCNECGTGFGECLP